MGWWATGLVGLMTVLLVLVPMPTRAQSELAGARVLVLHSYHQGFTWTDQISRGIEEAFAPHAADVELIFEFMDTRRWHDEGYFEALHAIYKPDDNARDRAITAARRADPAADHAAEAVTVYDLQRVGTEGGGDG